MNNSVLASNILQRISAGMSGAAILAQAFADRAEADGGVVESQSCLTSRVALLSSLGFFNSASLALIPSAYKESKLYSILPATGGGDFGFVRAGTRNRTTTSPVTQTPLITYFGSTSNPADGGSVGNATPIAITPVTNMVLGQLCICVVQSRSGTVPTVSVSGGQAWNLLSSFTTTNITARVFWCKFNGSWSANPSFVVGTGASVSNTVVMHVFSPTVNTNSWAVDVDQVTAAIPGIAPIPITGQTTTKASTVTLAGWLVDVSETWSSLSGTGWIESGLAQYRNVFGNDHTSTYAHKIQTAAGATGTVTKTKVSGATGISFIVTFYEVTTGNGIVELIGNNVPALDYTGRTCPVLSLEPSRTNLVLRSEEFDNAAWTLSNVTVVPNNITGPDGISSADKVLETVANAVHAVSQPLVKAASILQYTWTAFIRPNGRDWVAMYCSSAANSAGKWFNLTTGTLGNDRITGVGFTIQNSSMTLMNNGFYRCQVTITSDAAVSLNPTIIASDDGSTFSYVGDITKGFYVWGAQLEQAVYATSYIPTTTGTVTRIADAVPALLPSGTNQALQSQTFDNASWVKSASTVTANTTNAPDGTLTADSLLETIANASHFVVQTITKGAIETLYTFSAHIKGNGRDWMFLELDDTTNGAFTYFNVATGVIGTSTTFGSGFSVVGATITASTNGFYRVTLTARSNTAASIRSVICSATADGVSTYIGDITKGLFVWGAQLEQGNIATTYVATTTVPVHNGTVIGQTQGTIYFDGTSFADTTSKDICLTDGTLNNRVSIIFSAANAIRTFVGAGGVTQADISNASFTTGVNYKVAVTFQLNKVALFVNGVKIGEDLTVTVPICNQIQFNNGGASAPFYGNTNGLAFYTTALTDGQAISLTTP
jgi:hypothetical protein